jgi:hypothetical protein
LLLGLIHSVPGLGRGLLQRGGLLQVLAGSAALIIAHGTGRIRHETVGDHEVCRGAVSEASGMVGADQSNFREGEMPRDFRFGRR